MKGKLALIFMLTVSPTAKGLGNISGKPPHAAQSTYAYAGWQAKLLERGHHEDYLKDLQILYKYGALLYFKEVERHRKEISQNSYTADERMIDILKLAGILHPSSTLDSAIFLPPFKEWVGDISSRPCDWSYKDYGLFFYHLMERFRGPERTREGLSKAWAEVYMGFVEKKFGCRDLGCLIPLYRLYTTYPYALKGPKAAPEEKKGEREQGKKEEHKANKEGSLLPLPRAQWQTPQREERVEEEEGKAPQPPPRIEELPEYRPKEDTSKVRLKGTFSFPTFQPRESNEVPVEKLDKGPTPEEKRQQIGEERKTKEVKEKEEENHKTGETPSSDGEVGDSVRENAAGDTTEYRPSDYEKSLFE